MGGSGFQSGGARWTYQAQSTRSGHHTHNEIPVEASTTGSWLLMFGKSLRPVVCTGTTQNGLFIMTSSKNVVCSQALFIRIPRGWLV